jgi:CheY-like chemotaxis protein
MIKVLIVDDHQVVRQGLRTFLELHEDILIVGEAGNGGNAVAMAAQLTPDVILMDLVMPGMDGITATSRIKSICPDARVIALTSFTEDDKIFPAIQAGASSYLLKDVTPDDLVDAILRPGNWGNLLAHSTDLYNQVSAGVKTNFPNLPDAIRLAKLALSIPLDHIQQHVINYTMMAPTTIYADNVEQAILRPFPDKIREVVDQTFGTGSEKPMAAPDPNALSLEEALPLMKDEAASVVVINGSGVEGMAAKTADYLKSQGVNVTAVGNMGDYNEPYQYLRLPGTTGMIVHAGKPYAMQYFMKLMNTNWFVMTYDPNASADILLVIGADWASNNPMP